MFRIFHIFSVTEMEHGMQNMYANVIFINTKTKNAFGQRGHGPKPLQYVQDSSRPTKTGSQ